MFLVYIKDSCPPTNVRSSPHGDKIGSLDNGTVVTVKQALNNGWLEIEKPIKGYIYGELTQPHSPQIYRDRVGSIAIWQHLLNGCGYHPENKPQLEITGWFDQDTIDVTKKFQENSNLEVTGECTLETWQAAFDHNKLVGWRPSEPRGPHPEPPDSHLSEADKYDYCRQVILEHEGNFQEGVNRRNIISFRCETSTKANNWQGLYDDKTFMVWKDAYGYKHCCEYKSNTEPSSWFEDSSDSRAKGSAYGRDANRDSRKDLGCLKEGYYEYRTGYSSNLGNVLKPTAYATTVIRDIDHDGIFEDHEPMLGASDMLFHMGFSWRTGSAGCQTMPPDVYTSFWGDLTSKGDPGVVGYTIVRWKSL
jgi:hypothetical protein